MVGPRFGRSGKEACDDQTLACDSCRCGDAPGGRVRAAARDDSGIGARTERLRDESRPGDARTLDANAAWLKASASQLLLVEGHCDERGTNEYNVALGDRRAKAAMNYLVAQGVRANRITVISYGEERPLCTEHNEACWSQNRRAHFLVRPQ